MSEEGTNQPGQAEKLDNVTNKLSSRYNAFAKSTCGTKVLEFVRFEKNIVPYTLQILFVFAVLAVWYVGIAGIFGSGPFAGAPFLDRFFIGLVLVVGGPFAIHYALELVKYVWTKIVVVLWDKIVIRFFVNVLPELLPFMTERFMKYVDILLDGLVVVIMTVAAVLKGVVWLPKKLCQRLGRWCDKSCD